MLLIKKTAELTKYLEAKKQQGISIGFVPTMGALHAGHLSLIEVARQHADLTVCSIFVNPTQFNDPGDFEKYPSTLESDILLLEKSGTDLLFLPDAAQIYPQGRQQLERYELGYLETILEGASRPGHFQGVCQVMARLLRAVAPDRLFMGLKDFQQCMVVKKLLQQLELPIEFYSCATRRESDGLAMSSRNLRLGPQERKNAVGIYQALLYLKNHLQQQPINSLIGEAENILRQHHFKVDYVVVADAQTLEPVAEFRKDQQLVALVAAFQQEVRLIDNMLLNDDL